jgi:hypothetical protein
MRVTRFAVLILFLFSLQFVCQAQSGPHITAMSPNSGERGTLVTVTGTGLAQYRETER